MPYEKDVQERQWWWCPKWYWPFAVCSGIRMQHKWVYQFSWVKITIYGVVAHYEGCENGKLYTWTKPGLGIGNYTHGAGDWEFDSSLGADEGRCDESNTGLAAQGLSVSDPFASSIHSEVLPLKSTVVETGEFDFSGEHERLCQKGRWPWTRRLHHQVIIASVATRFVTIQWYVGGVPVSGTSGTLAFNAFCRWPFPLPKGRNETRLVHVSYEVITQANKSTLKVFNDPKDGAYALWIAMSALENGISYGASDEGFAFKGETCDFDPAQVEGLIDCVTRFKNVSIENAKSRKPLPGEPVFTISNDIWKLVDEEKRGMVGSLTEIMKNSLQDDPQLFAQAMDLLEQEVGLPGVSMPLSMTVPDQERVQGNAPFDRGLRLDQLLLATLIALAVGYSAGRLLAGSTQRLR